MASEFGLLALNPTKKLAQQQPNPGSTSGPWMWNTQHSRVAMDDDDSWEVRAFAEDTGSIMGTTWPPRSYTCTFCRREFRSAQALGGHMNVHRRDRARLRQSPPVPADPSSSSSTSTSAVFSSSLIFPSQEFAAAAVNSGGLCLVYPFPNPGNSAGVFVPTKNGYADSPSTLLSISPFPARKGVDASLCNVGNAENAVMSDNDDDSTIEELDLELRLGQKPSQ